VNWPDAAGPTLPPASAPLCPAIEGFAAALALAEALALAAGLALALAAALAGLAAALAATEAGLAGGGLPVPDGRLEAEPPQALSVSARATAPVKCFPGIKRASLGIDKPPAMDGR
jgi:hypothetical protein